MKDYADDVANLLVRVYEIHEVIIAETGGIVGLREATMLHSAVARPFATFAGQELYPTNFEKAAALFHSLIKSHPFMDGTKRTAFSATLYFLSTCGYVIPNDFRSMRSLSFAFRLRKKIYVRQGAKMLCRRQSLRLLNGFRLYCLAMI